MVPGGSSFTNSMEDVDMHHTNTMVQYIAEIEIMTPLASPRTLKNKGAVEVALGKDNTSHS